MTLYVSLGPNCHAAGNLKHLHYRNFSLPFDWMLTEEEYGIQYVNNNINNDFSLFTKDLAKRRGKTYSKNYPESLFFHHNLLKNPEYIKDFERRGKRFMDLISNPDNDITFLFFYAYKIYQNPEIFKIFYESIKNFENNPKIKANFKLLVYVANNDDDFKLELYPEINNLKKTVFLKYIRDTKVNRIYGNRKDFQNLLDQMKSPNILKKDTKKDKQENIKKDITKNIPQNIETNNEFIIKPIGGMCTRIRVILSHLGNSRFNNKKIIVVWSTDEDCNGFFPNFFEPINKLFFVRDTNKKINYTGNLPCPVDDVASFILNLKNIKPNKKIQDEIDKFINQNLSNNYTAIHHRSLDSSNKLEMEKFVKNNNKNKVFIATDNKDTQKEFSRIQNTIYYKPIKIDDKKLKTNLEHAIIDFFICLRASKFMGTKGSAFTDLIEMLRILKN